MNCWRCSSNSRGFRLQAEGSGAVAICVLRPRVASARARVRSARAAGRRGRTARSRAASARCIEQRADVNAPQPDGMTALHWAAYQDDLEIAALLVRAGANAKAANRYGVTPLSLACTNGNGGDRRAAAEGRRGSERAAARRRDAADDGRAHRRRRGASRRSSRTARDVDGKDERRGQTALMWAAAEGHADIVEALIEAGADFQRPLPSGFTPLLFAVREGHIDVVRVLLKAGADVNETVPVDGRAGAATAGGCRRPARRRCSSRSRTRTSSWRRRCSTPAPIRMPTCRATPCSTRSRRSASRASATTIRPPEGSGNTDQPRAREEARGARRQPERADDEEGEPEQHAPQRDRRDAVHAGGA